MEEYGPLSALYRRYLHLASGGAAESEGPAADQNDRGIAAGSFGGTDGITGGGGALSQAVVDHMASPATTGSRNIIDDVLDAAGQRMSKDNFLGAFVSGALPGPVGPIAGIAVNALEGAALANAKDAVAKGELTRDQFADLIQNGTPQIDTKGHTHGTGPGGINNGGRDAAGMGAGAGEGDTPYNPTPGAGSAAEPIRSTRYIPATGDYEQILINSDGTRTDLHGNPLRYGRGGATPGAGSEPGAVSGLFAGGTPGRADLVSALLPEKAYILPADVVSAAGDGNTEAGALSLAHHFTGGPLVKHTTIAGGPIKARVSAGEFYVSPEDSARKGGPDALDKMVKELRKHYAKHLTKLPDPKK